MTEPIKKICDLLTQVTKAEWRHAPASHTPTPQKNDFFADLKLRNGCCLTIFVKDDTSYVCIYGNDFKTMRDKLREHRKEVVGLAIDKFKVHGSKPEGTNAVWCSFQHRGGEDWCANYEQVVYTVKIFLNWLLAVVA